jgi:hypothetical protein
MLCVIYFAVSAAHRCASFNNVWALLIVHLRTCLIPSSRKPTTALLHGRHVRKSRKRYVLKRGRSVININTSNNNTVKAVKHHHHVKIVRHQGHDHHPPMMLITERAAAAESGKTYHTARVLVKLTRKQSMMGL